MSKRKFQIGLDREENLRADRAYWSQPFLMRAYMRSLYAVAAFLIMASIWQTLGASLWVQCVMGAAVAISVLLFRVAYPGGFGPIEDWISEGMVEAAKEMEEKGQKPSISSKELEKQIQDKKSARK